MNKKARIKGSTKLMFWLIIIYLGLGAIYHFQNNPNGPWTNDLISGGFQQLKIWFKF